MAKNIIDQKEFLELKAELMAQHKLAFKVVTDSMVPIIAVGEQITVVPCPEKLKPFDIIVMHQNNMLICHFVWQQNVHIGTTVITRNYRQKAYDLPVEMTDILGLVSNKQIRWWQKLKFLF